MPTYSDEAIVLRTHKLGEADRIITLLTRQHGVVRAVAKGVRRTRSKFGSRLEPFTHVDLQLAHGRSLDIVTQAETRSTFTAAFGGDYDRYTAGTAMLEAAARLASEERQPVVQQFLLLIGGLRALDAPDRAPRQVLDAYLLRSLAVAGYAPSFGACAHCGRSGPHRWFNYSMGGSVCGTCRVPGSTTLAPETLAVLAGLLSGDWESVNRARTTHVRAASGVVAGYVSWHLERSLRSLALVERTPSSPPAATTMLDTRA